MKRTKDLLFYFFQIFLLLYAGVIFSVIKAHAQDDSVNMGEFKTVEGKASHTKDKKTIPVKVGENDKLLDIVITETDSETREGKSELIRNGKTIPVKVGGKYRLLDIVITEANTEALIQLKDESIIVLGGIPESKLISKEYVLSKEEGGQYVLAIPYGEMRAMTCIDRFEVEAPWAILNAFGSLDFTIWESTLDGQPASCLAVLKGGVVEIKNSDPSIKDIVRVPKGEMSCVTAGEVPSTPITIPDELLDKLIAKGNAAYTASACQKPCAECEMLNPHGICVPDNLKPCDDGDICTVDDRCVGGMCVGKRDPSPVDPNCP